MARDFEWYHDEMLTTLVETDSLEDDIFHMAFGLAEEAGVVAGKFKRLLRGDYGARVYRFAMGEGDRDMLGPEEAREKVLAELGDVLWYTAALAHLMGSDLGEVAEASAEKLEDRKERGVLKGDGDNR